MRITGWHVDGFGLFADYRVEGLPVGLTVLHGPNEAGKTTLVSLILGVLFGFPGGRKTPQYEPLRGGRHGGRVFIEADDGQYTIERLKKGNRLTLTLPDGTVGTADDLKMLLGHADRGLFRNIFAFSLHELESLAALQDEAVKERIFAAPALGAGRSPREVLKALETRKKTLLKPSASSEIGDLRRQLKDSQSKLEDARRLVRSYPDAVSDLREAEKEVERIKSELADVRTEVSRYETLIAAWPEWSQRVEEQEELETLETPEGASPEIASRLIQIREQIKERSGKLESAREELEQLQNRFDHVKVDERIHAIANRGKRLYAGASSYTYLLQQLAELDADIKTKRQQIEEKVKNLGPGWTRERVAELDASIPTTAELNDWCKNFERIRREVHDTREKIESMSGRLNDIQEEHDEVERQLSDHHAIPTTEQINTEERSLHELHTPLIDLTQSTDHVKSGEELVEERQGALDEAIRLRPLGVPTRALIVVIALLLIVAGGLLALGQGTAGAGLLLFAAILGVLSLVSNSTKKHTVGSRMEALETARQTLAKQQQHLHSLEQRASKASSMLGFEEIPTTEDIDERLLQLGQLHVKRVKLDLLAGSLEQITGQRRRLQGELSAARKQLNTREAETHALGDKWQSWRSDRGVPETLSPEVALQLFPAIKAAKEAIADLSAVERHRSDVELQIQEFEDEAAEVLEAADTPHLAKGPALVAALENLHRAILEDEDKRRDLSNMKQGIAGAQRKVENRAADLDIAISARQELFSQVDASTEEGFTEVVGKIDRRLELEKSVADRLKGIKALIGRGAEAKAMFQLLETGELADWNERTATAEGNLKELEELRDRAVERRKEAGSRVAELEQFADIAALQIEAESYREELARAIGEWKKAVLAQALIEKTLLRFEQEHQPQVVARAAKLFEQTTDGRYVQVVSGEDALVAVGADGARVDLIDLSTGTLQQLYLCLRLALAEEFAARGTVLPVVMDDVLVNFDPRRAEQVAAIIAGVSERHQVLLFTCHPQTRDLAKRAGSDVRVIELERNAG